ncbi:MAG TPA: ATP-grasp domain-containing protein [Syntrophomonadaceae bacterium]|nr:ATP-grasp domain-containing protein [Syntrophomonadaceae bacterium]
MNILVTAVGSALAADITIKTLKGGNHYVIGCGIYPQEWIAAAGNVDVYIQAPPVTAKELYIDFINEICRRYAVQYIMPLNDLEIDIICEIKKDLLDRDICACMPDHEVTRLCRDKYQLAGYLKQNNLCPTIPTCLLAETDAPPYRYPMVAKNRFGRASEGMLIIHHQAEFGYVKELTRNEEYVLQPFIDGNIINADVIRESDDSIVCIARRDLLRYLPGIPIVVEIIANQSLTELCIKIANSLGIIGAANFEFIETPDQFFFMEINPRFSGGAEFSHLAGYDVVSNHLRCFTGQAIDREIKLRETIITRNFEVNIAQEV